MNINHLRQRKTDALAKANAIMNAAETEKRDFTDTERTEYDAAMASVKTLNGDIARAELLLDEERAQAAAHVPAQVQDNAEKKPWASFGEFLLAAKEAATTHGRKYDPRLHANGQGANETVDSEGGFLVQPDYAAGLWKRTYETGLVTSRCTRMPMSSNQLKMMAVDESSRVTGSRWGGIQTYRIDEAAQYIPSKPKFRPMTLTAKKLIGLMYATEELLMDAPAIEAFINMAFPDEFAWRLDNEVLNGNGASEMLGIVNSGVAVTVSKDSGQTGGGISTTNVLNMWARLYARSWANAVWFINQAAIPGLLPLTLGSGTAVSLLYTAPGVNGNPGPYGLLMGRPVIPIEQTAATGTLGDIILADLSQYLIADRSGIRADQSMHVAFLTGEQAFRFMLRNDGQPFWNKPLTPANSGPTVSPFVVLQTRT